MERLEQYDFTIAGQKHCNADIISRIPCSHCGESEPNLSEKELSCISMVVGEATEDGDCTMRKLKDSEICPLLFAMKMNETLGPYSSKLYYWWQETFPVVGPAVCA